MNSIRSPMAEYLVKELYGKSVYVESAGVSTQDMDGFMLSVMAERGINLSSHDPNTLQDLDASYFDVIITFSKSAHHHTLEFTSSEAADVEYWPIADPSLVSGKRDTILQAYRETRNEIENRIRQRFGKTTES